MSEFQVEVVRVCNVQKHPNADSLMTAEANGYPVIFKEGAYQEGSKAVHVPIDSIVPADDPRWEFLGGHRRIKAKRLRGIFSMGLLADADPSWEIGQNVQADLRIEKYDPDLAAEVRGPRATSEDDDVDPGLCPVYDIEGLRKFKGLFEPGELVWVSEKIHGQNARFVHDGERLHVGSRGRFKKPGAPVTWNAVAARYGIAEKLAAHPGIALYGETYGNNTDMPYGVKRPEGDRLVIFDVLDTKTRRWFSTSEMIGFVAGLDLPVVPTLYKGPWSPELVELSEGKTTMPGADHVREGIVVKPLVERFDRRVGRVFLKLAGQGYLLRKGA
jgi:RNA ligase (TIGR02306 family)